MQTYITSEFQDLNSIGFKPTLVIAFYIYEHENYFFEQYETILKHFPDIEILGSSSESVITNEPPYSDHHAKHKSVFIFTDMKKEAYSLQIFFDTSVEAELIDIEKHTNYNAILFSTHNNKLENDQVLSKLNHNPGIKNIFGALAGNSSLDFSSDHVSLFYNGEFNSYGYIFLFIDETHYTVRGESLSPFEPIGFEMNITKVDEKSILEIEGKPALPMMESMIGELSEHGLDNFNYPFYIWNPKTSPSSKSIPLRALRKVDRSDGSLHFFNYIDRDSKIKPAIRVRETQEREKFIKIRDQIEKNSLNLMFICVVYKSFWKEMEQIQLTQIADDKSKASFCGFHTFGEVGYENNTEDCSVLHNQTLTYVSINESKGL